MQLLMNLFLWDGSYDDDIAIIPAGVYYYCVLARRCCEEANAYFIAGDDRACHNLSKQHFIHWGDAAGVLKPHAFNKLLSKKIIFYLQNPQDCHWTFTAIFNLRSYILNTKTKLGINNMKYTDTIDNTTNLPGYFTFDPFFSTTNYHNANLDLGLSEFVEMIYEMQWRQCTYLLNGGN